MSRSSTPIRSKFLNITRTFLTHLTSVLRDQSHSVRPVSLTKTEIDNFIGQFDFMSQDEKESFVTLLTNNKPHLLAGNSFSKESLKQCLKDPSVAKFVVEMISLQHRVKQIHLPRYTEYIVSDYEYDIDIPLNNDEDFATYKNELEKFFKSSHIDWNAFWDKFRKLNAVSSPSETRLYDVIDEIQIFRVAATKKLQASLNDYLSEIAQSQRPEGKRGKTTDLLPYDHKVAIVDFVHSNLEKLGLAIQYKGHPCSLTCLKGTSEGRFALVPKGHNTALLARSNLSDFLPLELMDATKGIELEEFVRRENARRDANRLSSRE